MWHLRGIFIHTYVVIAGLIKLHFIVILTCADMWGLHVDYSISAVRHKYV